MKSAAPTERRSPQFREGSAQESRITRLEAELSALQAENGRLQRDLNAILQSRTWRLGVRLQHLVIALRQAPFKYFFLYRKPVLDPDEIDREAEAHWSSLSNDPHFKLALDSWPLTPGWYRFKLQGSDESVREQACLYLDYGSGYSEDNRLRFNSFGTGGMALARIGSTVTRLRLDPVHEKASFQLCALGIRPISRVEAILSYAVIYIQRQRQAGVSPLNAIRSKVAQLGGWRKLRFANLSAQVNVYQARVSPPANPDQPIQDYGRWIEDYEKPFLEARYRRPRSMSCLPVLVSTVPLDTDSLHSRFRAEVYLSSGDFQHNRESGNRHRLNCNELGQLIAWLLEEFPAQDSWFVFCHAPVALNPYLVDSLDEAISGAGDRAVAAYFDHDFLDDAGHRRDPHFKPDWSPEAYRNSDYLGPLCAMSRSLLDQGRERVERMSPDQAIAALLLAPPKSLPRERVRHIPEIQYHLTGVAGPTPRPLPSAVAEQLLDGYGVESNGLILPTMVEPAPLVSIIIPTKDSHGLLSNCIESIARESTYTNYEIILVDNGTTETEALDYIAELEDSARARVIRQPGPFNYSALNNAAAAIARGSILLLLNNDIEVISPDWMEQLVRYAVQDDIGCVGAMLRYPDGSVQHAGVILGVHGVGGHGHRLSAPEASGYCGRLTYPQEYTAVTAACLAIRKSVFDSVGGLNEEHLAVAFNDVDLCIKTHEAGLRNIWTPLAEMYHLESVSRGDDLEPREAARLALEASYIMQHWPDVLRRDPAYNPNLTLLNTDFTLSTRYLLEHAVQVESQDFTPSEAPYHWEDNIVRVSSVLKQDSIPPAQAPAVERKPGLSIIILTLEKYELISQLLYCLVEARPVLAEKHQLPIEIIVGDTGSTSEEVDALYRELEGEIVLVRDLKYHFSRCNNQLFTYHSRFDTALFLNNDIEFDDAVYSLSAMHTHLYSQAGLGAVGAYMLYPTGRLQHGGVDVYRQGRNKGLCFHPGHDAEFSPPEKGTTHRYPAVTGACLMMPAAVFEQCNYFDEAYHAESQDVDLCLKAHRYGLASEVIYTGRIIHYENGTRKKGESNPVDRARFIRKWATYQEVLGDVG